MIKDIDKSKEQLLDEIEKLRERSKELNCFYSISKLFEKKDLTISDILQNVVNLMPVSWHYPELACVKINYKGKEYYSYNSSKCKEKIAKQKCDIVVNDRVEGYICVSYIGGEINKEKCLFLKEEYKLLDAIAERLGHIIERKQAKEKFKKEKFKYNLLFKKSSIPLIILHPKKGVLDVNDLSLDLFCYDSKEKMLGLTFLKVSPKYQFNQELSSEKFNENCNEMIKKKHISFDWVFKDFLGREFMAKVTCNVIEIVGDEVFQIAIQDITKEREAEQIQKILYNISNAVSITDNFEKFIKLIRENLSKIIDTTNFYIALYDEKTKIISLQYFDDEKDSITSFPIGKTLTNYVIKTKKPLLAKKTKILELEKLGEIELFGAVSEIWLGVPLKVAGKITGVIAVQTYTDENAYDESDMKMLEFVAEQISVSIGRKHNEKMMIEKNVELLKAKERAEESDRLKSSFLANMSHEIRTPMNGILGFAELLKDPNLSGDEQKEYISIIERSGVRMLNIINELIDISKLEAGQMEVFISETNINQQIDYLNIFFKPEVERKGMKLFLKKSLPDNEAIINTDREKIYAILTNLIKNSIKYSKEGFIEFGYEKKNEYIEFFVKDTGIGIPKNKQQAVFERFIQADLTLSKDFEGAGLGLSITKAYIEMLSGKIWLDSVEGKGSQFYFTIPYNTKNKK